MTVEEKNGYRYFECTTEKTRLWYGEKRRRIPISPMMEKVLPYIELDNAVNAAKKTISDALKRIFPARQFTNCVTRLSAVVRSRNAI